MINKLKSARPINEETEELLNKTIEEEENELNELEEQDPHNDEIDNTVIDFPSDQLTLRTMVRGVYDLQKLRIMTGNRIVMQFKERLGQSAGVKESQLGDKEKKVLDSLRTHYKKITDGVVDRLPNLEKAKENGIISNYIELALLENYFSMEAREAKSFRQIEKALEDFELYTEFLRGVRGVGPAIAGVILSEMDIRKATYVSSLWAYTGLDVAPDGKGRSMRKEHMIEREYVDKNGEVKTKMSLTFKPHLKAKMIGVLAPSFLRSASPYANFYYNYKNRLDNHVEHKDKTKLHKHNMSLRYMIKRFYVDLYVNWRTVAGLPVHEEYSVAKLGIIHHKGD